MAVKVECISEYNSFSIKFNDITHLRLMRNKVIAYESWMVTDKEYYIEIVMIGGTVQMEYNDFDKWNDVLKALDENLYFA